MSENESDSPASAETEAWIDEPPSALAVSGAFATIGGPYSLSVTITLKESLRKLYFETEVNTPDETDVAADMEDEEAKQYLTAKRNTRTTFGCAENVGNAVGEDPRKVSVTFADGEENASLSYDGSVPDRKQITTLTLTSEASPALAVRVVKTFSS